MGKPFSRLGIWPGLVEMKGWTSVGVMVVLSIFLPSAAANAIDYGASDVECSQSTVMNQLEGLAGPLARCTMSYEGTISVLKENCNPTRCVVTVSGGVRGTYDAPADIEILSAVQVPGVAGITVCYNRLRFDTELECRGTGSISVTLAANQCILMRVLGSVRATSPPGIVGDLTNQNFAYHETNFWIDRDAGGNPMVSLVGCVP